MSRKDSNNKKVTIAVYLDADLVQTLKSLAEREERTVSAELSVLLKSAFKHEGIEIVKADDEND